MVFCFNAKISVLCDWNKLKITVKFRHIFIKNYYGWKADKLFFGKYTFV